MGGFLIGLGNMQFITQGKTNLGYLFIVVVIAIIAGGFMIAVIQISECSYRQSLSHVTIIEKETKEIKTTGWMINVSEKMDSPKAEFIFFRDYLRDLFDLSIVTMVFDIRKGEPYKTLTNFSYYILINEENELKDEYENESIIVRTSKIDESLIPYIKNPDYCEKDTDCVIRTDFCAYGAYNYYHAFHDVWGCPDLYENEFGCALPEPSEECYFGYDEKLECFREIEYTGTKCLNNLCVAKNRTVNCYSE